MTEHLVDAGASACEVLIFQALANDSAETEKEKALCHRVVSVQGKYLSHLPAELFLAAQLQKASKFPITTKTEIEQRELPLLPFPSPSWVQCDRAGPVTLGDALSHF